MRRIVPIRRAAALMAALIALVTIGHGLARVLEARHLEPAGLALGAVGTGLIAVSFVHSLRKRGVIRAGSPRVLLRVHETLAWSGALAVVAHAGVHVHALLPWLGIAAMLAAVTTGMIGELLLGDARRRLEDRERMLRAGGLLEREIERRLMAEALAVRALELWRVVHLPVAINFAVLAAIHVVTVLLFH